MTYLRYETENQKIKLLGKKNVLIPKITESPSVTTDSDM